RRRVARRGRARRGGQPDVAPDRRRRVARRRRRGGRRRRGRAGGRDRPAPGGGGRAGALAPAGGAPAARRGRAWAPAPWAAGRGALMAGRVVAVHVRRGDRVEPDGPLVVLEAMKMENEFRATAAGVVAEVAVSAGQAVNAGDLLVAIAPSPAEPRSVSE